MSEAYREGHSYSCVIHKHTNSLIMILLLVVVMLVDCAVGTCSVGDGSCIGSSGISDA